jgi:hypothetical protein
VTRLQSIGAHFRKGREGSGREIATRGRYRGRTLPKVRSGVRP